MKSSKIVRTDLPPCSLTLTAQGLLVGSYELDKATGLRTGSLDIFNNDLVLKSSLPTSAAILDTKSHNNRIYTADSAGTVTVYDEHLQKSQEYQLGEGLITQIALRDNMILATMTTGELIVLDEYKSCEVFRTKAHDLEAWTVSFGGKSGGSTVFTGGDDRTLAFTDLRIPYTMWKVKPHEAGVTSILPRSAGRLWTGGYDDCLVEFDIRARKVTNSVNLGGGVWRLEETPEANKVLACCMYGGFNVLDAREFGSVIDSMCNHKSMVYGGVWVSETDGITCSFYDKMLQKWTI